MEEHKVKILAISEVTHDVLRILVERPDGYNFIPGQATEVSINQEKWKDEKRPFTFTSVPKDKDLEFTIKTYTDHEGVTNKLRDLKEGDELILHEVWGAIQYKDEGIFLAGGAGITPFVSILRQLRLENRLGNNKLIFANKTSKDIIYEGEFRNMLRDNFINVLNEEKTEKYRHGFITTDILKENNIQKASNIYLCGPPPMMEAMHENFEKLGIDKEIIVEEEFE